MKKSVRIAAAILFVAILLHALPGHAENVSLYTFQNGVSFGMSQEEVKQTLKANARIDEKKWITQKNEKWQSMSYYVGGKIGSYVESLTYDFNNDRMMIASYNFTEGYLFDAENAAGTYENVTRDLKAAYGECEEPTPGELVRLMNSILTNYYYNHYEDSDFRNALVWRMENGSVYQFYYSDYGEENNNFVIIYTSLFGRNSWQKDSVVFGRYEQDNDKSNGAEPIEWLILKEEGNKALLISKHILDAPLYHSSRSDVTWETCDLRTWLNDSFLNTAFTVDEQEAILLTDVDNTQSQCCERYETTGGTDTQDRIFILSYAEACSYEYHYFVDDVDRMCAPTDYALRRGASTQNNYRSGYYEVNGRRSGSWWLRSPGNYQCNALIISNDGAWTNMYVNNDHLGVRPVLWVDLESEIFNSENNH